jgi:hypothetical protein
VDYSWTWWLISIIPALRRLKQKDPEFEASLGYTARPYLKKSERKEDGGGGAGRGRRKRRGSRRVDDVAESSRNI